MMCNENGVFTEEELIAGFNEDNEYRISQDMEPLTEQEFWANFVEVVPNVEGEAGYDPDYADYRPAE